MMTSDKRVWLTWSNDGPVIVEYHGQELTNGVMFDSREAALAASRQCDEGKTIVLSSSPTLAARSRRWLSF